MSILYQIILTKKRKKMHDIANEDFEPIEIYDEVQTEQITKFIETVENVDVITTTENVFKLQFSFYDGRKTEKTWTEKQWLTFKETEVYALCEHIAFKQ